MGLLVLRIGGGQLVPLLLLPVSGPRLSAADVHLLVTRELDAEQEERDGAERRFHPVPRPYTGLEHGVQIAGRRHTFVVTVTSLNAFANCRENTAGMETHAAMKAVLMPSC